MIITENIESIKNELAQCRNAADKGYKLAADKYAEIRETLREEEEKIAETNRKQNELSQVKNSSLIEDQMKGMEFLKKRVESIGDDVIALHAQQKDFSIVLYGRTMAGKSTLSKNPKTKRTIRLALLLLRIPLLKRQRSTTHLAE